MKEFEKFNEINKILSEIWKLNIESLNYLSNLLDK